MQYSAVYSVWYGQRFPQGFVFKSPWDFHGLFGGPTDRVGDSFNIFMHPLSKLCVSDALLHVREKHVVKAMIMLIAIKHKLVRVSSCCKASLLSCPRRT